MTLSNHELDNIINQILEKLKYRFRNIAYTSVVNLDADSGYEYSVGPITGNCVIYLLNAKDGDSGIIRVAMDSIGGYTITLGAEFNKRLTDTLSTDANSENYIFWTKIGSDIIYSISTVQT